MKYDAVIFDLFGTLIENFTSEGYRVVLAEMANALCLPADQFLKAWSSTIHDRMAGRCGDEEGNVRACAAPSARIPHRHRLQLPWNYGSVSHDASSHRNPTPFPHSLN